jgi:pimeloyl-ACP methyl ester carboxylesterase
LSEPAREAVVLIHGLWLNGLIMKPLAWRLKRAGFVVHTYSYPSVALDFRANAARLNAFLASVPGATVHLVGHSLGGILIRALFQFFPQQRPGRLVTLGSPHQGTQVGRHLEQYRVWQRLMGRSVEELLEGAPQTWAAPARELGVIQGQRSVGMGKVLYRPLPQPNDGLLTLAEASLPAATAAMTLPVSHTGMLVARTVAEQVVSFLKTGRFAH